MTGVSPQTGTRAGIAADCKAGGWLQGFVRRVLILNLILFHPWQGADTPECSASFDSHWVVSVKWVGFRPVPGVSLSPTTCRGPVEKPEECLDDRDLALGPRGVLRGFMQAQLLFWWLILYVGPGKESDCFLKQGVFGHA